MIVHLSGLLVLGCSQPPPPTPPDVVLVVVDTLRADAVGWGESIRPTTPHLDALAAESARFTRAYASSSWTLPSMATLLTGTMPWEHGAVRHPEKSDSFGRLNPQIPTLAEGLKTQGYRTAAFVNNAYLAPEFGLQRGFDLYDYQGAEMVGHRSAAQTVDAALAWLSSGEEPALLLVHVMEPHLDYEIPPSIAGRFTAGLPHTLEIPLTEHLPRALALRTMEVSEPDRAFLRAAYDEEVLTADLALGSLVEGLKARDSWDRLRLAFTSDHGEEFWDHGGFEHGHSLLSEVTRVPCLLKIPGAIAHNNSTVLETGDIYQALLSETGPLVQLARSGQSLEDGQAISEGVVYGPSQTSLVTSRLRVVVDLQSQSLSLWPVSEGRDAVLPVDEPAIIEHGRTLFTDLRTRRGGIQPAAAPDAIAIPERETFERLRALGYIEGD